MKLTFSQISQETNCYTFSGAGWFPQDEVTCAASPQAEIQIRKERNGSVTLLGALEFTANLPCDRCGEPVQYPLREEFQYIFTLDDQQPPELAEIECSDEDCITVQLKEPVIDVNEILREQVFLAIPGKVLCTDDCRGICPVCGALLNKERCGCSAGHGDSPFAILQTLRKNRDK